MAGLTTTPYKIVELGGEDIKIHVPLINTVLDKVGSRPFAVISVNGEYRKGKSFLLNLIIHRLKNPGGNIWNGLQTVPNCFPWKKGCTPVTEGVNLWPEPFILKDSSGNEFCVLLLDCQGNFDNKTSTNQNAMIFACSTLLSSLLIWNQPRDLSEDVLQFLECFLGFASLASEQVTDEDNYCDTPPANFQTLMFLIRDFQYVREYGFGLSQEFADKKLSPNRAHEELNIRRRNILSAFKETKLFALPHPGEQFVKEDDIKKADQRFLDKVGEFVDLILSPELLLTKHVNGKELSGVEFKDYVKKWAVQMEANELPTIQSLAASNAEIEKGMEMEKMLRKYTDDMRLLLQENKSGLEAEVLMKAHQEILEKCVTSFKVAGNRFRRFTENHVDSSVAELTSEIESKYGIFAQINAVTRENTRSQALFQTESEALKKTIAENEKSLQDLKAQAGKEAVHWASVIAEGKAETTKLEQELAQSRKRAEEELARQREEIERRKQAEIEEARRQLEELQRQQAAAEAARQAEIARLQHAMQVAAAQAQQQRRRRRRRCIIT